MFDQNYIFVNVDWRSVAYRSESKLEGFQHWWTRPIAKQEQLEGVNAVSLQQPVFWKDKPTTWFNNVEAQFEVHADIRATIRLEHREKMWVEHICLHTYQQLRIGIFSF